MQILCMICSAESKSPGNPCPEIKGQFCEKILYFIEIYKVFFSQLCERFPFRLRRRFLGRFGNQKSGSSRSANLKSGGVCEPLRRKIYTAPQSNVRSSFPAAIRSTPSPSMLLTITSPIRTSRSMRKARMRAMTSNIFSFLACNITRSKKRVKPSKVVLS